MSSITREVVIEPQTGLNPVAWEELWERRELFFFLVLRDIKVRYKQTVLGVAWAGLQPLVTMLIFTVIFGVLAKVPSSGVPYSAFVLAGLLPWTLFSSVVTQAGQSLLNQQALLTKIYLPRLFFPASAVGTAAIDFCISFVLLLGVMLFYGFVPGLAVLAILPLTMIALFASVGAGIWLSAQTVSYRDFRFVIPFMMQCWMYVSPVVYPVSIVPKEWRWVLGLNPMSGVIDGYRSALFGLPWDFQGLALSTVTSLLMLVIGIRYFQATERRFADIA